MNTINATYRLPAYTLSKTKVMKISHYQQTFWLSFILLMAYFSYMPNIPSILPYLFSTFGIIGVFFYGQLPTNIHAERIAVFLLFFLLSTIASTFRLLLSSEHIGSDYLPVLQSLAYPVFSLILVISLGAGITYNRPHCFYTALIIALTQATFALANTLVGPLTLPVLGRLEKGRAIFFTSLGSSSGLMANVNYYSMSQLMLFWFLLGTSKSTSIKKPYIRTILALVLLSTILGSSRGVMCCLFITLFLYWMIRKEISAPRIVGYTLMFAVISYSITTFIASNDDFQHDIRVNRGLNGREIRWESAFIEIRKSPWLGHMINYSVETGTDDLGSAQSTTITSLLRVGILGTFAWLIAILYGVILGIQRPQSAWALCALVSWILDGFARTYSFGGVGLIPLIALLALIDIISYTPARHIHPSTSCRR